LLISFLVMGNVRADAEGSPVSNDKSCSIELSKIKSPDAYLVALVEDTGETKCNEKVCADRIAVIEVLAAGPRSANLKAIYVGGSAEGHLAPPKGHRAVGVYVLSSNPKIYLWMSKAQFPHSLESKIMEEYKEAVELANSVSGAPHCRKDS